MNATRAGDWPLARAGDSTGRALRRCAGCVSIVGGRVGRRKGKSVGRGHLWTARRGQLPAQAARGWAGHDDGCVEACRSRRQAVLTLWRFQVPGEDKRRRANLARGTCGLSRLRFVSGQLRMARFGPHEVSRAWLRGRELCRRRRKLPLNADHDAGLSPQLACVLRAANSGPRARRSVLALLGIKEIGRRRGREARDEAPRA